jgi:4-amino-4-deoxy-L-arabinose transferase-like glycosyltransferase
VELFMTRSRRVRHSPLPQAATPAPQPLLPRRLHWAAVPLLLVIAGTLAISSLVGDSSTFDESSHLASGMSYLKQHDFRLAPDHPPLGKLWAAAPLLLVAQEWPGPDTNGWRRASHYEFGQTWLFELNAGRPLLLIARIMMVLLLLGTCLAVYAAARTLAGPDAALLALILATFSPTLLAHGRLVTTDMPVALCAMLVLLTGVRLLERVTWPRFLAAAAALGALSVAKFSWPLVLIGPLAMMLAVLVRRRPLELQLAPWQRGAPLMLQRRVGRAAALALLVGALGLTTWAAVWTCYGWRYTITPAASNDPSAAELQRQYDASWRQVLTADENAGGLARAGLSLTRVARDARLLPEAYLYGFAWTLLTTQARQAYLMGQYPRTGDPRYFPLAFAIKTPVATLLVLLAGLVALARCWRRPGFNHLLLLGLLTFGVVYGLTAVFSRINIGHRHIMPLYPVLFVLAGAAAAWWTWRPARWLTGAAIVWLAAASLWIHPHYLAYFNELIGGPANGHKYLADSNIDWGQDLLRLAAYGRKHPDEPIHLAYFGSVSPAHYGIRCAALPSNWPFGPRSDLSPGTYVVSVTQLLGVYDPAVRDEFWRERARAYAGLYERCMQPPPADQTADEQRQWAELQREFDEARRRRLLNGLQHRRPDERIGYSLFVFRLTAEDIAELIRP